MRLFFNLLFLLVLFAEKSFSGEVKKLTRFTIFSGDGKASYYQVARGICNVFNRHYLKSGFECEAIESKGSAKNLELLARGDADFAIIKSSEFNQFFIKDSKELQNKTNFISNLHEEYLTILAQKNLKIKSIANLGDRIVNPGSIGSTSALIIEKYLTDFAIKPKEIVNFGAAKSFEILCDKKIDAWIYFIGHPNSEYKQALEKCDLELVSASAQEINNFLKIAPFFKKTYLPKNFYSSLKSDLKTISTTTILTSRKHLDQIIIDLIKDILVNHKDELIKENQIFNFLPNN